MNAVLGRQPLPPSQRYNTINEQIQNIAQFFTYFETFEMRKIKKYIEAVPIIKNVV